MTTKPLPNKPSELLSIALKDLEKLEKNPKYRIDMHAWHEKEDWDKCHVCLAGCVMANRLGVPPETDSDLENFEEAVWLKLWALDKFVWGEIEEGLSYLIVAVPTNVPNWIDAPYYENDKGKFKLYIKNLIKLFKENGI